MLLLDATNEKIDLVTSAAGNVDAHSSWADMTSSSFTPGNTPANITTATNTDIVGSPAASTQRKVQAISARNRSSTVAQSIVARLVVGASQYELFQAQLQPGESLQYTDADGWRVHTSSGAIKMAAAENAPLNGYTSSMFKVGTTAEAAGVMHTYALATGLPSAWAPGTPGLNGRNTDGTTSADAGCVFVATPAAGSAWLVGWAPTQTVAHACGLLDVVWVNTGLVVTTTTSQAITTPTLPARDQDGSTNGKGYLAYLLVTTATTNAGAVTNMTLAYTASNGSTGRTATMASFPATAQVGTMVPFQLQAGDLGIRAITGIVLGTSLVTGAVSLVLARQVTLAPATAANLGGKADLGRGAKLWAGSCLLPYVIPSAVTATTLTGLANIEVRA